MVMEISVDDLRTIARATADAIEEVTGEPINETSVLDHYIETALKRYDIEVV